MTKAITIFEKRSLADRAAEETLSLLVGAGLTLGLFMGMARFENGAAGAPPPEIEELRAVSAPLEPPPPRAEEPPPPEMVMTPLTGLDIGASESPVKIAVVPPDLDSIIPATEVPPRATIQFAQLYSELRPRSDLSTDFERVYKQSEVDQVPTAVIKTIARVSRRVREDADTLRVTLELVIDAKGDVTAIRVVKPSGNAEFDTIVVECVRHEWVFSPAVRKGKKVKCLVQQLVWYKWTTGSPFTI